MRAAIFIDGAYLQKLFQGKNYQLNYAKLADHFLEPLRKHIQIDLLRCYFYHCPPWSGSTPSQDELRRMNIHNEFADMIEGLDRWGLRLGKLEKRRDGDKEYFEQKRVDVLLSCDLVKHSAAGHIQHAILIAGDSDLIPAVKSCKESGVTLTLWCGPDHTVHRDLISAADEVHHYSWSRLPKQPLAPPSEATKALTPDNAKKEPSSKKEVKNPRDLVRSSTRKKTSHKKKRPQPKPKTTAD